MRTREGFIDLGPTDLFDFSTEPDIPFKVTMDVIMEVLRRPEGRDGKGRISLLCPVDPFKDSTCPEEWHAQVSAERRVVHQVGGHGWPGWGGGGQVPAARSAYDVSFIYIKVGEVLEEFRVDGKEISPTGVKMPLSIEGRA